MPAPEENLVVATCDTARTISAWIDQYPESRNTGEVVYRGSISPSTKNLVYPEGVRPSSTNAPYVIDESIFYAHIARLLDAHKRFTYIGQGRKQVHALNARGHPIRTADTRWAPDPSQFAFYYHHDPRQGDHRERWAKDLLAVLASMPVTLVVESQAGDAFTYGFAMCLNASSAAWQTLRRDIRRRATLRQMQLSAADRLYRPGGKGMHEAHTEFEHHAQDHNSGLGQKQNDSNYAESQAARFADKEFHEAGLTELPRGMGAYEDDL